MELREQIFLVLAALERLEQPADQDIRAKFTRLLYDLMLVVMAEDENMEDCQ